MQTQRLRIAIQKKGRLSKECQDLLKKCGVKFNIMGERLVVHSLNMPIDLLLVRDDDIPGLIMDGVVDLGFIGENELEEVRLDRLALKEPADFQTLRRLDFGGGRLSIAINKDVQYNGPQDLAGKRIATTDPQLLRAYMDGQGVDFSTCMLTGSDGVAPRAGLAGESGGEGSELRSGLHRRHANRALLRTAGCSGSGALSACWLRFQ